MPDPVKYSQAAYDSIKIGDLDDVDTSAKSDGSLLQYNNSTSKFVARNELKDDTGDITLNGGAF